MASRVPHQKFYILAVNLYVLDLEVDANSGDVLRSEAIIAEFLQKATLADLRVAKSDQLDFHVSCLLFPLGLLLLLLHICLLLIHIIIIKCNTYNYFRSVS